MSSVILLGAPGSGKGTIAKYLKDYWKVPHISTGDIFREAIAQKTLMGLKANEYLSEGKLVPDDIVIGVVEERFKAEDLKDGFILDGFPRTVNQAVEFDRVLLNSLKELSAVILLTVSDEIIIDRISGRRVCKNCGKIYHIRNMPSKKPDICDVCSDKLIQRKDDNSEIIKERLIEYYKLTAPLIDYYKNRNLLIEVDASTNPETMLNIIKGLDL